MYCLVFPRVEYKMKCVKCVVWDLDNTVWNGILSEGDDVQLKPGIVEIFKALDRYGVLQSIASKNNESDVLHKLQFFNISHYFLYPQINWNAKSGSIGVIREKLNIGMDTFLFVDDQPFERDEVRAAISDIECVDAKEYSALLNHPRIASIKLTDDARFRRQRYQEDQKRDKEMADFKGPPEAFLATLNMKFKITHSEPEDLFRAEELTERTNQLNSTGVTYNREELEFFMNSETHDLLVCELKDKYGSYGKIGLTLVEHADNVDVIKLLLMSCRTASRGAGSVLLNFLMHKAKDRNVKLRADFKRTDRNRQMLVTYQFANFNEVSRKGDRIIFENDLSVVPEIPHYIELQAF